MRDSANGEAGAQPRRPPGTRSAELKIPGYGLPVIAATEEIVGLVVDVLTDETDRAVSHGKVTAPRVVRLEPVEVAPIGADGAVVLRVASTPCILLDMQHGIH